MMKGYIYSSIIVLLLSLIFVTTCSINSSKLTIEPFQGYASDSVIIKNQYQNYSEAMQNFAAGYVNRNGMVEEYQKFTTGLELLLNREFETAEKLFIELVEAPGDSLIQRHAKVILREILLFQSKWGTLVSFHEQGKISLAENNLISLVRAFHKATPEKYQFPDRPVILPTTFSLSGVPQVEVAVNGVKKKFWIDTGASFSVLASHIAAQCGVKPIESNEIMANTTTDIKVATLPAIMNELKIGDITIANHPALIIDNKDLELKLFGFIRIVKVDGILGWNAIQKMNITIDSNNKTTTMQKPVKKVNPAPNFYWLSDPIVRLTSSDGRPFFFGLDVGANSTCLSDHALTKIDTTGIKVKKSKIGSAGGFQTIESKVIPGLAMVLNQNHITFADISTRPGIDNVFFKLDGILGNDVTGKGCIHLDFINGEFELILPVN